MPGKRSRSKIKPRYYITGFSGIDREAIRIWQHFREDASNTATLKELVLEGLKATEKTRIRLVQNYANVRGLTFEQAWLEIASGNGEDIDVTQLSPEEYQKLFTRLGDSDLRL